jgi:hypothetical protein
MAGHEGRTANLELVNLTVLDWREGGADEEVDDEAKAPAVRSRSWICNLRSPWFATGPAQPLSRVRALRGAANAGDAHLSPLTELAPPSVRWLTTTVAWDRDVFLAALEGDGDAQDCFQIFHTLFEGVTHEAILESLRVRRRARACFGGQTRGERLPSR